MWGLYIRKCMMLGYNYYCLTSKFLESESDKGRDFVLQAKQVSCPFTRTWNTILGRMEKMKQIDSLVNYGLVLMFPIVAFSSWLSHWRWEASYPDCSRFWYILFEHQIALLLYPAELNAVSASLMLFCPSLHFALSLHCRLLRIWVASAGF